MNISRFGIGFRFDSVENGDEREHAFNLIFSAIEMADVRGLQLFAGHFPGHPVLPGVILMEALAQAACCCLLSEEGQAGRIGYLAGIDKAKFRRTVLPGDTVTLEAVITRNSPRMCVADVVARVEGEVCAQATQKYVMAKMEEEEEQ